MLIQLTRRQLLTRAAAGLVPLAVVSTLVACGTVRLERHQSIDPLVRPDSTLAPAPPAPEAPRRGGTLRFGNIGDFTSLEGQTIGANGAVDQLYGVWDRLIFTDASQHLQPMLAESWEVSADSRQITFKLRRGVQFHTGRELTADDVKWSLLRIQDPKIGSVLTGRIADMTEINTPDKYTVIVKASRPWVEAFDLFE